MMRGREQVFYCMLLFDATHHSLKPVVAELQHAGRKGRSRALYRQRVAGMQRARQRLTQLLC